MIAIQGKKNNTSFYFKQGIFRELPESWLNIFCMLQTCPLFLIMLYMYSPITKGNQVQGPHHVPETHFTISLGYQFSRMNKLEFIYPKSLCDKFRQNWLSGSGEASYILSMHFCQYLHINKGMVLHLNKSESSLPKKALWQFLLKLAKCFRRCHQGILICCYLPVGKGMVLQLIES